MAATASEQVRDDAALASLSATRLPHVFKSRFEGEDAAVADEIASWHRFTPQTALKAAEDLHIAAVAHFANAALLRGGQWQIKNARHLAQNREGHREDHALVADGLGTKLQRDTFISVGDAFEAMTEMQADFPVEAACEHPGQRVIAALDPPSLIAVAKDLKTVRNIRIDEIDQIEAGLLFGRCTEFRLVGGDNQLNHPWLDSASAILEIRGE